jgi:hypothetical protein
MRILFAISLVALAALLWASMSIAQHIHRSRRRRQHLVTEEPKGPTLASAASNRPVASAVPAPGHLQDESSHHRKAS